MRKIILLAFLFILNFSLNAYMSEYTEKNYAKAKGSFSKENFNLINERLNNYDFKNEYDRSKFFSYAPKIRGDLRKIGIKEKSVFLDALDVVGYLIKNRFIYVDEYEFECINSLINGSPNTIFNDLIELLDSDEIDYPEKYGEKAIKKFKESYSKDKSNTVKQILKQILADLPKD